MSLFLLLSLSLSPFLSFSFPSLSSSSFHPLLNGKKKKKTGASKVGLAYYFLDIPESGAGKASELSSGVFGGVDFHAWSGAAALDANDLDAAFFVGMLASVPGVPATVPFPTSSFVGALQRGGGPGVVAARTLVSATDGQLLRGDPAYGVLRTGDSTARHV